jgi:hypothetical protein
MPRIIAATTAIFCRIVQFLYYTDVDQIMLKSLLVSVFFEKKTLQKYVDMFLACPKSKVTIKLKFYYSNLKNAVETAKIAVDSCYVLRQFLTSLPSIDFREIRGLMPPPTHLSIFRRLHVILRYRY